MAIQVACGFVLPDELLDAETLSRYAEAVVDAGVGVRRGDLVVVQAQPQHRQIVVAIAEAAYRRGARHVQLETDDRRVASARFRAGGRSALGGRAPWLKNRARALMQPDAAVIGIRGEGDPDAFAGVDPKQLAAHEREVRRDLRAYSTAVREHRARWTLAGWPTPAWAGLVYPELPPLEAQRRLAADLVSFCRVGPGDGEGTQGWVAHVKTLEARAKRLGRLKLTALELRGPGTELRIGLLPEATWAGGRSRSGNGRLISPNLPTEEVFTSPVPRATEGTFRCSLPLIFQGRLIDGIEGEFRGGKLVRVDAAREADRDLLAAFLDTDAGARRLGEVALVDSTSRVGRAGRVYYDTLLDENAAAHIAFGGGFPGTRPAGAPRVNQSALHLDVMIGSDELEVTGIAGRGRRVPLIAGGLWQI